MKRRRAVLALFALGTSAGGQSAQQAPSCDNNYPAEVSYRLAIANSSTSPDLRSDGKDYLHDRSVCLDASDDGRGFFKFAHPNGPHWPECRVPPTRSFTIDLSHPVPGGGGLDRGAIVDNRPHMQIHTRLDANGKEVGLQGMSIGETVKARYSAISATGHQLRLYFNPTNTTCPSGIVHAPGSTPGIVTRTSATRWEIDFPSGSIGRLLEGPEGGKRNDGGLYYFRAHFTIESR